MEKPAYSSPYGFHLECLVRDFPAEKDGAAVTITRANAPDIRGCAFPERNGILIVHGSVGGMDVETFVAYEDVRGIARFCEKGTPR